MDSEVNILPWYTDSSVFPPPFTGPNSLIQAPSSLSPPDSSSPEKAQSWMTYSVTDWGMESFLSRVRLYNVFAALGQRENKNCLQRAKCTNSSQSYQQQESQRKLSTHQHSQVTCTPPLSNLLPPQQPSLQDSGRTGVS